MIVVSALAEAAESKPCGFPLPPYRPTSTSGIEDGTNSGEVTWVVQERPARYEGKQGLIPLPMSALAKVLLRHALCVSACFGRLYIACLLPSKPRIWRAGSLGRATARACTARPTTFSRWCCFCGRHGGSRDCPTGNSTA